MTTKRKGRRIVWAVVIVLAILAIAFAALQYAVARNGPAVLDRIDRLTGGTVDMARANGPDLGGDPARKLRIFTPGDNGPYAADSVGHPVLLFVHGGGWHAGDPDDYTFIARTFVREGYVVVLAGYRLFPDAQFPAMLEDTAAAIAWTKDNIAQYGGSPDHLFLAGHSAGAYNVVMATLDPQWLGREGLGDGDVAGVIGLAGPYDFLPLDSKSTIDSFGKAPQLDATQPVNFARAGAPPMLFLHGEQDTVVRPRNSRILANRIERADGNANAQCLRWAGSCRDPDGTGQPVAAAQSAGGRCHDRIHGSANGRARTFSSGSGRNTLDPVHVHPRSLFRPSGCAAGCNGAGGPARFRTVRAARCGDGSVAERHGRAVGGGCRAGAGQCRYRPDQRPQSINAFVAGGQAVYIHSGLINAADTANEVQGVIAHEIGHITGGHIVRYSEGAGAATNISILSLILGGVAAALGSGEAATGIIAAGQRAAIGRFLAFSRVQESSADAAGAQYLSKAGISGRGSLAFFKKLQQQEFRYGRSQADEAEFTRTHPLSGDRIARLRETYIVDPAWDAPDDRANSGAFHADQGQAVWLSRGTRTHAAVFPDHRSTACLPATPALTPITRTR